MPAQVADVVVVGAGMAGLATAVHLRTAGSEVVVLERAEAAGGRVRTDLVDGLRLDRGFQLINPAYPEARRVLDLDALDLMPFEAGVAVATGDRRQVLGDPLRLPSSVLADLTSPIASLGQKLRLLAWAAPVGYGPGRWVRHRHACHDMSLGEALRHRGLDGPLTERVLRPFLAGVLADEDLASSSRLGEMLVRSFLRGTPAVPALGMQAIPDQLESRLPAGSVRFGVTARRVESTTAGLQVLTDDGAVASRAVVVATEPPAAAALIGRPARGLPRMNSLTTYWFHTPEPPSTRALLHVDGEGRGPLANTAVVTNAAPGYARDGALVGATVVGARGDLESQVRRQAGLVYGVDATGWTLARTDVIRDALPVFAPGTPMRRRVDLGGGLFVAGDHRDTPSLQGALVSGRRAAEAVLASLRG